MDTNPTLYGQQSNSQKIRFIVITAIVAVVILGIAVWAIVAMVSGRNRNVSNTEDTTVATKDDTDTNVGRNKTEEKSSDITTSTDGVIAVVPAHPTTTTEDDLPSTGPEDVLPLALTLGSLTACVGSALLLKK